MQGRRSGLASQVPMLRSRAHPRHQPPEPSQPARRHVTWGKCRNLSDFGFLFHRMGAVMVSSLQSCYVDAVSQWTCALRTQLGLACLPSLWQQDVALRPAPASNQPSHCREAKKVCSVAHSSDKCLLKYICVPRTILFFSVFWFQMRASTISRQTGLGLVDPPTPGGRVPQPIVWYPQVGRLLCTLGSGPPRHVRV